MLLIELANALSSLFLYLKNVNRDKALILLIFFKYYTCIMTAESESIAYSVGHFFLSSVPIDDIEIRVYGWVVGEVVNCWRYDAVA